MAADAINDSDNNRVVLVPAPVPVPVPAPVPVNTEVDSNNMTVVISSSEKSKIGHRRTTVGGTVTYRKIETSQIMGSIQLGVHHSIGGLASAPERDVLAKDFNVVEQVSFPSGGSNHTPPHHYSDFRFETYAPMAFRYFRQVFKISTADFLVSMCSVPMRELSNPGASGSIFYLTHDDKFIVKTVEKQECRFLQKLLPGYWMSIQQNPDSFLPKFYGLFYYRCNSKNIRLVVMNNLLPSSLHIHQKYDVKGSTYKRKASATEREKASPTFKDLDFKEHHPDGIQLEVDVWQTVLKTLTRDTLVLESFEIMDYSLLIAVHRIPLPSNATTRKEISNIASSSAKAAGGISARNNKGEPLVLLLGLIDILQSYGLRKKVEHNFKALLTDGDTISVHRPGFYSERFNSFLNGHVFRKISHPTRQKSTIKKQATVKLKQVQGGGDGGGSILNKNHIQTETEPPITQGTAAPISSSAFVVVSSVSSGDNSDSDTTAVAVADLNENQDEQNQINCSDSGNEGSSVLAVSTDKEKEKERKQQRRVTFQEVKLTT